ncbi:hypothetical protein TTHERM_00827240 (macronuclear) [Tetrahymena thermophila SB210]|uniref:Uncharacterized protein n=1 Tax=Tetrahymena thermophila (strain SB210) TaxID=312017 RepID=Q22EE5_TETTS|nr:hypothetical protein TTHERM_00827240 [Tetrahymena thermophila SB210]EAR83707.1 hypothetical protein TTHERM_00827240 [Tetrahymena thermophila SB210]|eukprot:XP_001031370.1 hypothetical protein TTHERM_00827240 [Tetrahymena thermophila SB210]
MLKKQIEEGQFINAFINRNNKLFFFVCLMNSKHFMYYHRGNQKREEYQQVNFLQEQIKIVGQTNLQQNNEWWWKSIQISSFQVNFGDQFQMF